MAEQIIAQAAEAIILKKEVECQGTLVPYIIKRRIKKGYRLPELDEKLRKLRTRGEARLLEKSSKIISVPKVLKTDEKTKEIELEFIEGKKLSENLDNLKNKFEIIEKFGEETAKLHDNNIIHGDLTTSNMILVENNKLNNKKQDKCNKTNKLITFNDKPTKQSNNNLALINDKNELNKTINNKTQHNNLININKDKLINASSEEFKVYIIDFGLGFISPKIEDKAVDLHLIKQALEAKHFLHHKELFETFLKGYKTSKESAKVLEQLKKVEARGRYKH